MQGILAVLALASALPALARADRLDDADFACTLAQAVFGVAAGPPAIDLPAAPTCAELAAGRDVAIEAVMPHARSAAPPKGPRS